MTITAVILTFNEERHIARALQSVAALADQCVVVDSGSTDRTVAIARAAGAKVLVHPFVNQAQQFNWALDQLETGTDWVLRLDADEIVTPELAAQIKSRLNDLPPDVRGVSLNRRIIFMGRPIRWGGIFPVKVVRLFRSGYARSEDRWMDEHIVCNGRVVSDFAGEIHDINLTPLDGWIAKHNAYASREVVELLDAEIGFLRRRYTPEQNFGKQAMVKRWLKTHVYSRLPRGIRPLTYFIFRYLVCLGFLDGQEGAAFHILQGFWYRYLVDMKLREVKSYMQARGVGAAIAIRDVLGIDLSGTRSE